MGVLALKSCPVTKISAFVTYLWISVYRSFFGYFRLHKWLDNWLWKDTVQQINALK